MKAFPEDGAGGTLRRGRGNKVYLKEQASIVSATAALTVCAEVTPKNAGSMKVRPFTTRMS
ncbi:hypothetical protein BS639_23265 [Rouxiella silvae]|uniref:Uncharacterized protein n=1 Tax=Rouxiella silvae TaxID=1646373 RepID=A0ABX3TUA9_9GAMM|nr:hypothetical protein [Rouxiella silvae]ORJ18812.1 hypothetical protein BS639_23265 [Rouxiella silvae]